MRLLGKSIARALVFACTALLLCAVPASADYDQGFDSLADSGWTTKNLSSWTDVSEWRQSEVPNSQPPEHVTYLRSGAGYLDPWEADQHLSDWLISPSFSTLSNGDVVGYSMYSAPFWFGHPGHDDFELRLATGATCSTGTTAEGVGDFTTRLLTIDPQAWALPVTTAEYMSHNILPKWSKHSAVIRGLPEGEHSGCFGLRRTTPDDYWVVNWFGLDDFSIREDAAALGEVEFYPNATIGTPNEWWRHPLVRGRADPGSTVSFFRNATCSGDPFATASADQFDWPGVRLGFDVQNTPYTVSASSSSGTSECESEGLSYLWDSLPPTTVDDVGDSGNTYPGPVKLSAVDLGYGVDKTYFTVGENPPEPTQSSAVYDSAAPPVLTAGEKISYFSVDKYGNAEDVKTSGVAPAAPPAPVTPEDPTGVVTATSKEPARIRPSTSSLSVQRGRVGVVLICEGGARASDCTGRISLDAVLGSKYKPISIGSVEYSVPAGSIKLVKLRIKSVARSYLTRPRSKSTWAKVRISSTEQLSFRRKLRG